MNDERKTKKELIKELNDLRLRRSVEVVLRQIRDKVWQMRAANDLDWFPIRVPIIYPQEGTISPDPKRIETLPV